MEIERSHHNMGDGTGHPPGRTKAELDVVERRYRLLGVLSMEGDKVVTCESHGPMLHVSYFLPSEVRIKPGRCMLGVWMWRWLGEYACYLQLAAGKFRGLDPFWQTAMRRNPASTIAYFSGKQQLAEGSSVEVLG